MALSNWVIQQQTKVTNVSPENPLSAQDLSSDTRLLLVHPMAQRMLMTTTVVFKVSAYLYLIPGFPQANSSFCCLPDLHFSPKDGGDIFL
jgi:hypothetical protein